MSTYAVDGDKLTAIADAIRLKRDITTDMTLDEMPLQINLIDGGGSVWELLSETTLTSEQQIAITDFDITRTEYNIVLIKPSTANDTAYNITMWGAYIGYYMRLGTGNAIVNFGISILSDQYLSSYANGNVAGSAEVRQFYNSGLSTANYGGVFKYTNKNAGFKIGSNMPAGTKVLIYGR